MCVRVYVFLFGWLSVCVCTGVNVILHIFIASHSYSDDCLLYICMHRCYVILCEWCVFHWSLLFFIFWFICFESILFSCLPRCPCLSSHFSLCRLPSSVLCAAVVHCLSASISSFLWFGLILFPSWRVHFHTYAIAHKLTFIHIHIGRAFDKNDCNYMRSVYYFHFA